MSRSAAPFIWNFAEASFAERQGHVREGRPNKHGDTTKSTCENDLHN
jgi:hypothetical protein